MTLFKTVMYPLLFQQHKYELGKTWAEDWVNKMDNMAFLELLSDALELMKEQK